MGVRERRCLPLETVTSPVGYDSATVRIGPHYTPVLSSVHTPCLPCSLTGRPDAQHPVWWFGAAGAAWLRHNSLGHCQGTQLTPGTIQGKAHWGHTHSGGLVTVKWGCTPPAPCAATAVVRYEQPGETCF